MITEEQTRKLCKLINARDDANELMSRFHQGYTNYDFEHCVKQVKDTKETLDNFIKTIGIGG